MIGYLVFDKTLVSYYCPSPGSVGWFNKDHMKHCIIEDREEAQKILRTQAALTRSTMQLLEIDIPDEEYSAIQKELATIAKAYKRINVAVGDGQGIKDQIDAKRDISESHGD